MRKTRYLLLCAMLTAISVIAFGGTVTRADDEKYAEITFEKTSYDFGLFDRAHGDKTCWFVFTNTGNKELIIKTASASCGCTDPVFPKTAILPGMKDSIQVNYKGSTNRVGTFRKTISLETNAKVNTSYLYIFGEMVEELVQERVDNTPSK